MLIAQLPDGFNQNKYESQSRALFIQMYNKNKQNASCIAMKIEDDAAAGEDRFRIKRPLEPDVDCTKLNHAQLVTKLNDEISSKDAMQQELNNYAQCKRIQGSSLESIAQECKRLTDASEFNKGQLFQSGEVHKRKAGGGTRKAQDYSKDV